MSSLQEGKAMSALVTVQRSEIIPEDLRDNIESRIKKGLLGPLSPDRESGPFMLYCCGDDFESISLKTNLPIDVLYVTAAHYGWLQKSASLKDKNGDFSPANIQKDIGNSLLIATSLAMKEQLEDVLSGRKKPSSCSLIPKNIGSLNKLMEMVSAMHNPESPIGNNATVVHAQNVQINQKVEEKKVSPEKAKENETKYNFVKGKEGS